MKNNRNSNTYVDIYSGRRVKGSKKNDNVPNNGKSFTKMVIMKTFLYILIFCLLGAIAGGCIYYYKTLHSFNYDDDGENYQEISMFTESSASDEEVSGEIFTNSNGALTCKSILNVLLVGSDSMSVGDGGRSDSILLISVDTYHKKIKITSIMRDMFVKIPGYPEDRINAAYAFGKSKLLATTIEKNFGVAVDRYAEVDFAGFIKCFDILGGLDVDLTPQEVKFINTYSSSKTKLKGSGVFHLNGDQILQYCRDRNSAGSDYDRTKRQRHVINIAIDKIKNANPVQLVQIVSAVAPHVTTNFKPDEITKFTKKAFEFLKFSKHDYRIPTDDNVQHRSVSGKSVIFARDNSKLRKELLEFIFEDLISKKVGEKK